MLQFQNGIFYLFNSRSTQVFLLSRDLVIDVNSQAFGVIYCLGSRKGLLSPICFFFLCFIQDRILCAKQKKICCFFRKEAIFFRKFEI